MSSNVLAGHFHELANGFFDQFLNIFHAACVCHLWQFTDFLDVHFLQVEGDSIPHLSGGLRKVLDGLSSVVGGSILFSYCFVKVGIHETHNPIFCMAFRSSRRANLGEARDT